MAVVIRMKRTGRRNRPCYRISVSDRREPRDGRTIESLGTYDPTSPIPELRLSLDVERAKHWVEHGALPSPTVRTIFLEQGVLEKGVAKKKRDRSGRKRGTKSRERRRERERVTAEIKEGRRQRRLEARKAAKAAAAESSASDS